MTPLEVAAHEYAARGWPVFPCKAGSKEPATPHGFKDATTDYQRIRRWWSRHPDDNVAVATGRPAPDVVDIDVKNGDGFQALERARRAGLLTGAGAIVRTPSGGAHIYYPGTDQPCRALRRHHLDFRSRGGYVVAPPSMVDGRPYQLLEERPTGHPVDFAAIANLLDPPRTMRPPTRRPTTSDGEIPGVVQRALERRTDDRSRDLYRLVGACLWAGLDNDTIHTLAASYEPATDKYGGRLPGEVDRCIRRIGGAA